MNAQQTHSVKKMMHAPITWLFAAILVFAMACGTDHPPVPTESQQLALELPCRDCCSSGIMNMMSDMGLMAYQFADFMNGMCQMMPFFGMFCPDLDQMAGSFFSAVLDDPQLTLDMMVCADGNPAMLEFMMHVLNENPELLHKMGLIMGQNESAAACAFTELFTGMALRHDNLKDFFFAKIDDHLYENLTYAMLCQNETTAHIGQLMEENAESQMKPDTRFAKVFMNIGTVEDDNDGNEMANERLFYAVFGNIGAANAFLNGMQSLDPEIMQAFMNFIFLGTQQVPEVTCQWWEEQFYGCQPQQAGVREHVNQKYRNLYATLLGFVSGVGPAYDMSQPPDPASEVPANALFGRVLGMLMDADHNLTPYGQAFFSAVISAANPPHCWDPAVGFIEMMSGMMQAGFMPFTPEQFEQLALMLYNQNAPAPRDFMTGNGDDLAAGCPGQAADNPADDDQADTDPPADDPPADDPPADDPPADDPPADNPPADDGQSGPTCDAAHPDLCVYQETCEDAGLYWCRGVCRTRWDYSCSTPPPGWPQPAYPYPRPGF